MIDLSNKQQIDNYIEDLKFECKEKFNEVSNIDIFRKYRSFKADKVFFTKTNVSNNCRLGYFDDSYIDLLSDEKPKRLFVNKPNKGMWKRYLFDKKDNLRFILEETPGHVSEIKMINGNEVYSIMPEAKRPNSYFISEIFVKDENGGAVKQLSIGINGSSFIQEIYLHDASEKITIISSAFGDFVTTHRKDSNGEYQLVDIPRVYQPNKAEMKERLLDISDELQDSNIEEFINLFDNTFDVEKSKQTNKLLKKASEDDDRHIN